MSSSLPDIAKNFLASPEGKHGARVIRLFHNWMTAHGVDLITLEQGHVVEFLLRPSGKPVTALTRNGYRYLVRRYLDWLHARRLIHFDPAWLHVRGKVLAEPAEKFLASLAPTLRPATLVQYRGSIRALHDWMDHELLTLEALNRKEMSRWFQHLHDKGQAPATRVNAIVAVRVYLRALNDAGQLTPAADDLIRASDLPKLPRYLPRPLEPTTDEILRKRLAEADDPLQRGLLVMRNTGLRIGELSALELNCLREDGAGNHLLKVPLGKMNNERLVPVDEQTVKVIQRLQREGPPDRTWLLETVRGRKTRFVHFQAALQMATLDLDIPDGMTSHRLRHTYATSLMGAGMSLMGVMKLLGHRDYRMTLRYTEITLETVGEEYHAALDKLEQRYRIALKSTEVVSRQFDPDEALNDIIRWVQKRAGTDAEAKRRALMLVKRLKRIREDVNDLDD